MTRHRPTPTLFPYTTLFRSSFAQVEAARLKELQLSAIEDRIEADLALGQHAELVPEVASLAAKHPLRERLRDRKSTRLNSSHRCISYAVFCLKKKKRYNKQY